MNVSSTVGSVVVSGGFDNFRSSHVRLLQEAARFGPVHLLLWSDDTIFRLTGRLPQFPLAERRYLTESLRFVERVWVADGEHAAGVTANGGLPSVPGLKPAIWVSDDPVEPPGRRAFCTEHGLAYHRISADVLTGFPDTVPPAPDPTRRRVIVTGCYDWLHSGHVRFFEEAAELGDLYVVVGHDANVRLLKGEGHPLQTQGERRFMVQAIRYVTRCLVSSGSGWMDAEPEIDLIKPHAYVVNEDGDKPEKAGFCAAHGIDYVVLKRLPKEGLARRTSTDLRGF